MITPSKRRHLRLWANLVFPFSIVSAAETPQIVERPRPAEWSHLVFGGRFMDVFEPMPDLGGMTAATWGAPGVVPRDVNNGIEDPAWSYWGGNAALDQDGKYHLLVCRWPENSPQGHFAYHESTVVHAVASNPFGPFKVQDEIGPGHNPTWYVTANGQYVLYVVDGRYLADSINGPWKKSSYDYDSRDRQETKATNYLHNNTFARREDGSFLMVNRHGQVWFSRDGLSTFYRITDDRIYPPVAGKFEDPVVWRDNVQYHVIVNDWLGRLAWYLRSKDGVDWKVEPGEAYMPGFAVHPDGTKEEWFKYERLRVVQDRYGRAIAANFAVIDVSKQEDLPHDRHSSKNIVIPMTVGRLLTVQNTEPLVTGTAVIRVRIEAESGFDPHTDVELDSLRFGASEEVNFGRGSKLLRSEPAGRDLLLIFNGQGHGLTRDDFAAKLLGRTRTGKLLFGWSRLPGVNYLEPILSTRLPEFTTSTHGLAARVEVQNFGQVASQPSRVKIMAGATLVGSGAVPELQPFEKSNVQLRGEKVLPRGGKETITVLLEGDGPTPRPFVKELRLP